MPGNYIKKEALRVRQMFKFKRPDGTEYENHVRSGRLDEMIEDLSVKDITCEDLGMRVGQIWRQKNELIYSPKLMKVAKEWGYYIVTNFDEDNWVYCKPYDIEKREIIGAYQSQAMERQSNYVKRREFELFEGELFKENK
jgi:hypothetical protein